MTPSTTLSIGLDVHKDSLAVAYVSHDHAAEVIFWGSIGPRPRDRDPLMRNLQAKAQHFGFVSEAGPCGSVLYRELTKKGYVCGVVAPSLLPKKAGDRVKTDRRDAQQWARLMRPDALIPVDVPTVEDAAIRDLCRAREDAIRDLKAAPCRLNDFWLRHDMRSTGRATWSPAHLRWLSTVVCPAPAQPMVSQE